MAENSDRIGGSRTDGRPRILQMRDEEAGGRRIVLQSNQSEFPCQQFIVTFALAARSTAGMAVLP